MNVIRKYVMIFIKNNITFTLLTVSYDLQIALSIVLKGTMLLLSSCNLVTSLPFLMCFLQQL